MNNVADPKNKQIKYYEQCTCNTKVHVNLEIPKQDSVTKNNFYRRTLMDKPV